MKYILFNEKLQNNINGVVINDIDDDTFIINMSTLSKGNLIGIKSNNYLSLEEELELSESILTGYKEGINN